MFTAVAAAVVFRVTRDMSSLALFSVTDFNDMGALALRPSPSPSPMGELRTLALALALALTIPPARPLTR